MSEHTADPARESDTLVDLLRWRGENQAERLAYTFLPDGDSNEEPITYGELDLQARGLAAYLQSIGAQGERALLLYPPGLSFLKAFFACLYAGVIAVPLYPPRVNRPDQRIQAIADDCDAKFALATTQITENLERRLEHSPDLDKMQWLSTEDNFSEHAPHWRDPEAKPEDLAYLQYTSGSTSTPKGVMVGHGNLVYNLKYISHTIKLTNDSIVATWLPHFHDMGLVDGLLSAVYNGALGYFMAPNAFLQQPVRWLKAVSKYGITHTGAPNFAFDLCVHGISPEQREGLDLSSINSFYNGAEPVRVDSIENFAKTYEAYGLNPNAVYPVYGLAEATLMVSGGILADPPITLTVDAVALEQNNVVERDAEAEGVRTLVACGKTWLETSVAIANPDDYSRCADNTIGEIWIGGPMVAHGYWERDEETKESFGARLSDSGEGPFFRTGDLGFVYQDELYITGRLKDLVIIRGRNHYPQDIELTVQQCHPDLKLNAGAAFSIEVGGEERLVVVQEVERQAVRRIDKEAALAAVREAIAEEHELQVYGIQLVRPGNVPLTSSGKIQRRGCRLSYLENELKVVAEWTQPLPTAAAASDDAEPGERHSAEAIRSFLKTQIALRMGADESTIDTSEPFTSYGLDSMELISVSGFLEQWLDTSLSPNLMYEYTSIDEVAEYLGATLTQSS